MHPLRSLWPSVHIHKMGNPKVGAGDAHRNSGSCGLAPTHEEQREDNGELVHSVTQDVLHHGAGDEWLVPAIWPP